MWSKFKRLLQWWKSTPVYASIYFYQGVVQALVGKTILTNFQGGMGGDVVLDETAAATFLFVVGLPWSAKLFLAPTIDLLLLRPGSNTDQVLKRLYYSILACSLVGLVAIPFLMIAGAPNFVILWALVMNFAVAMQDMVVDALSVFQLKEEERAPSQSLMLATSYLGAIVGGSFLIWLMPIVGWESSLTLVMLLCIVFSGLIPSVFFKWEAHGDVAQNAVLYRAAKGWFVNLVAMLKSLFSLAPLMAAVLALSAFICEGGTANMVVLWMEQGLEFDSSLISAVFGWSSWVKLVFALISGLVLAKVLREFDLAICFLLKILAYAALSWAEPLWQVWWFMFILIMLTSVADGVLMVALRSYFMALANSRFMATQFAVYMALLNVSGDWTNLLGGQISRVVGGDHAAQFQVVAGLQMVSLLPLLALWLLRRRRQR